MSLKNSAPTEVSLADWHFRQSAGHFARNGYAIAGVLTPDVLQRVCDDSVTVQEAGGSVVALPSGGADRAGFVVAANGRLGLTCQSCGASFDFVVDSRSTIYVAKDQAELDAWEEESFESIESSEKTSALELVEDELLLAIPYVPRCEACELAVEPKVHVFIK